MPDPSEETDIFDSAALPDTPDPGPSDREVAVPDAHADQLVSSMISTMQREGGGPAARRYVPTQPTETDSRQPPQQRQPGQELPSDMQGVLEALREERRARQDERKSRLDLERQIQELRNPRQPERPFNQAVFEDPDGAIDGRVKQHITPLAEQIQTWRTDMDFRLTKAQHGEEFDQAYADWFAQVGDRDRPDPQTYWGVMNAASPGEALMQWHQGRQIQSEIGQGGLAAYRAKIEREALERHGIMADAAPAPRGKTPERAPNGQFQPRHEVRLPTPTSRMGHVSREAAYTPEDGSEEAIFDSGRAKPSRS